MGWEGELMVVLESAAHCFAGVLENMVSSFLVIQHSCNIYSRISRSYVGVTTETLPDGSVQPVYANFRPVEFSRWDPGEDSSSSPCTVMTCYVKECTYVKVKCSSSYGYICEKPAGGHCVSVQVNQFVFRLSFQLFNASFYIDF